MIFPSVLRWRLLPALPRLIRLRRLRFRFLWRSRWAVWLVLLIGALNGIVVAYLGVVPFIATLGMQYAVRGVALVYTGGRPINALTTAFTNLGKGYAGPIPVPSSSLQSYPDFLVLPCKDAVRSLLYAIGGNEKADCLRLACKQLKF